MKMTSTFKIGALVMWLAAGAACTSEDEGKDEPTLMEVPGGGGKGDTPNDDPNYDGQAQCEKREQDMVFGSRKAFTEDGVRWAVADVEGVNTLGRDDRGQEYTEYFAVVHELDGENEEILETTKLLGFPGEPLELELDEGQELVLEENEFDEVGACIFTSWHSDMPPLECEEDQSCPSVLGERAISLELMRMKIGFNSNGAARDLIARCLFIDGMDRELDGGQSVNGVRVVENGDPEDPTDVLHRDFMRGCTLIDAYYKTGWRRSDPSVCAAAMRLGECGCAVEGDLDPVSMILPSEAQQLEEYGKIVLRGFRLGGWGGVGEEHLPSGCEYIRTASGDDASTMVRCSLTGDEVLNHSEDIKGYCRSKYANDLTVNVPINASAISCGGGDGPYGGTCSETPWVLDYTPMR